MKRNLSLLLICLLIFTSFLGSSNISFADNEPAIVAKHAVLMDYESGKILYNKDGNSKLYPASTTKVWTACLVLKEVKDLNQVIEIKDLPQIDGSSMYLKNGESFTVKQLLDALLVHSANDAAFVLARYVGGGNVQKFIDLMNSEAKKIGATNTHFNNPHGLPDPNHYTTAHDMALIAREAMNNDTFRQIVKTKSLKFEATKAYPYERYFVNTNKFLTSHDKITYKGQPINIKYDIVDGIKTGYTGNAGYCLSFSMIVNKNDKNEKKRRVIGVVLGTNHKNKRTSASLALLKYGKENFNMKKVIDKDSFIGKKYIKGMKELEVTLKAKDELYTILKDDESIKSEVKIKNIEYPVKKGDTMGIIKYYTNSGDLLGSVDIVSNNSIDNVSLKTKLKMKFAN
ncbi:D-alanyl-D-alanine carboxypeptidase family protein [Clostridioides difficile]|uniref:D-alanyl-D-alanine carboxypeptidase family protein n=1 Tax=Clostridioides difficile TaxID=1496 RepID=UPI0010347A5C|nr:D-alanyl-D-alanine carboxypeptidase family protein [Clostridioides difficile]